jgi:hypothetical protein
MNPSNPDRTDVSTVWGQTLKRRTLLIAMAAGAVQLGMASSALAAISKPAAGLDAAGFFRASQILTGYTELDRHTAERISNALIAQQPAMAGALATLAQLSAQPANNQSAEALLAAAKQAGIGDAALEVVAAWFKGTVGHGEQAVLVAYQQALMYRPVSDGLIVPTYCGNGPLWWTAPIPDASASIYGPRTPV